MAGIHGQFTSLILLLSLLLQSHEEVLACPGTCSCKWKAGKEWVECAGRGLQGLPQGAREETQVLDLSNNQLLSLEADCFFVLRLVNLQRLYLSRSRLRRVATRAFTGLQGLVELDLSDNELEQVPSDTFASIANLMRLSMAGNPLGELHRESFQHLGQLSFLELSRCQLHNIEEMAFMGLHALEWLRLNDNLLTTLSQQALPAPRTPLHGLPLHGNPWKCDCHLQELRSWLDMSQAQAPQEAEPGCAQPLRLKGRRLRTLKIHELACVPELTIRHSAVLNLIQGENASISCEVHANPKPTTLWLLNGEPLSIPSVTRSTVTSEFFTTANRYSYSEKINEDEMIVTMEIIGVEITDEGSYICQAENAAGLVWKNTTLHVMSRELANLDPPLQSEDSIENSTTESAGYAAAIAAGALLGTLLALGCLFLGIFFYARRLHSFGTKAKSEFKQITDSGSNLETNCSVNTGLPSGFIPASILKKPGVTKTSEEFNSNTQELGELSNAHPRRRFIEPDLINEVPSQSTVSNYLQQPQLNQIENYSNCLDRDGYPLNFGLPKLNCLGRERLRCTSLPRLRQRQNQLLHSNISLTQQQIESAFSPQECYSKEAEILMEDQPSMAFLDLGYAAVVQSVPLPPPPAYRVQLPADLSVLQQLSPSQRAGQSIQHPESPDEGYVGDALDV
ncbi:leucine-rich repeat-containing protein 24-like [Phymastichus coffea]|uniref:leucine-rich repeat-containing protein 24-like n=1 Tax=Phymastichus coffea TaxID=108790 RepID=UPI00273C57A3|nr:leucine-rich repeat-containing protein 24-like [Phymastichus coffea]